MFFEYAVEPSVLSTWQSVRFFLDAFGPWKGRFIAAYPKRWKKLVYDGLDCPDVEKSRIQVRLAALDPRVFAQRTGSPYAPAQPWVDNAVAEHGRHPFRAIIAVSGARGGAVLEANLVDDTNELWRVDPGGLLPRTKEAFSTALGLLIGQSSRVVLVDPFFRPNHPAKTEVLASLCAAANARAGVEVHVRLGEVGDPTEAFFKSQCETYLPHRIPVGLQTAIHAWRERGGGPRLHNRYLLTDVGGVQFGDSVEVGAAAAQDRLSILEEATRAQLWRDYVDPGTGFDRIGAVINLAGRA